MARRFSRAVLTIIGIVLVLGVALFFGVYHLLNRAKPLALGEHCQVKTPGGTLDLEIEQAQVAATIAAVAADRGLPERALEIAYITAIQESKLLNLPFGDRDSVGVFQQRPSQGWGTIEQLQDPVYATRKFFSALVKVKRYQKLPLHDAAQAVQRSADGSAYAQHEEDAKILADAFTGRTPKAVHCWYPAPEKPQPVQAAKARKDLARALGQRPAQGDGISAATQRRGWLIASWTVAHAQKYGLRKVRYAGVAWSSADGQDGWLPDTGATATVVKIA
ncbi:hypothetical protein Sme01_13170 [Sphaerisporangium melleum]|uniref:Co/Zn/Cd efflux system component n=1 Tax=Sphaerisporangium melleum TaxID=321316 RepID=A0A917VEN6_9ACTN|nr:hypothetical protein [Sphaerisporangium melleum]GGK67991.1 hypothetical protein GCM10007964_08770 [Sphaerisporangium melleum]GII68841.1 hypothetical protein Sme01_13170 [Sphaerisporangium melleum]